MNTNSVDKRDKNIVTQQELQNNSFIQKINENIHLKCLLKPNKRYGFDQLYLLDDRSSCAYKNTTS